MDPRRLSRGEWIAVAGGVLLLVSLFLPWYGGEGRTATAWETMAVDDVIFAFVGLIAIGGAITTAARPGALPVALKALTSLAGMIALVLVAWRLVDPAPPVDVGLETGAWLGLAGALAVAAGAWSGMGDEGPARRDPVAEKAAAEAGRERAELLSLPPDVGVHG